MIIVLESPNCRFCMTVTPTTRISHICAIAKYLLSCSCHISLVYQGHYLREVFELQDYDIPDQCRLTVQYRYRSEFTLNTSAHQDDSDAFYGSLSQQACFAFD